jgi:mannose-6-phosphate isomerase-like protein (cupin superfamily)
VNKEKGNGKLMRNYCLVNLGIENRHGYFIGATLPVADPAYSLWLDIGYNRTDHAWQDQSAHFHTDSEEYFIVLRGRIDLEVNGVNLPVLPGWMVGIRAGVPHRIAGVETPVENYLIRVPGGGRDKVLLEAPQSSAKADRLETGVVRLDLHQPHDDYLLGACLPLTHACYSPRLDFTCVWGVDPVEEWRGEKSHFHSLREEYYIVLSGRLDFEIDGNPLSLTAGQVLGTRQGVIHKVTGGKGPVDILFVRVPGGRGDKTPVEG